MKPPKLKSPSYANHAKSKMHTISPKKPKELHYTGLGHTLGCWALLEFTITSALHHLMDTKSPEITDAVLGTLDFKSRLEKLQKVAKIKGGNEDFQKQLQEYKENLEVPRKIRNLVSHLPVAGWDKSDSDIFYLIPFHGLGDNKSKDKITVYKLSYKELNEASEYAFFVGQKLMATLEKMPPVE